MKTTDTLRAEFKTHRAEALRVMPRWLFDQESQHEVMEISDGEDITPEMWVSAAYRVASDAVAIVAKARKYAAKYGTRAV